MSKVFATYTKHHSRDAEGHIYLNKKGNTGYQSLTPRRKDGWTTACTITLTGAVSMSQDELDSYGEIMAEALNKFVCGGI